MLIKKLGEPSSRVDLSNSVSELVFDLLMGNVAFDDTAKFVGLEAKE